MPSDWRKARGKANLKKKKAHAELVRSEKDIQAKLAEETTVVKFTEKKLSLMDVFGWITNKLQEELQKQFGIQNRQHAFKWLLNSLCRQVMCLLKFIRILQVLCKFK